MLVKPTDKSGEWTSRNVCNMICKIIIEQNDTDGEQTVFFLQGNGRDSFTVAGKPRVVSMQQSLQPNNSATAGGKSRIFPDAITRSALARGGCFIAGKTHGRGLKTP